MKQEEEIDRFIAIDDDGNKFIIICLQPIIERKDLAGNISKRRGLKEYFTSSGYHVNLIDPETFQIVETDQIIRKVR